MILVVTTSLPPSKQGVTAGPHNAEIPTMSPLLNVHFSLQT